MAAKLSWFSSLKVKCHDVIHDEGEGGHSVAISPGGELSHTAASVIVVALESIKELGEGLPGIQVGAVGVALAVLHKIKVLDAICSSRITQIFALVSQTHKSNINGIEEAFKYVEDLLRVVDRSDMALNLPNDLRISSLDSDVIVE